MSKLSIVIPVYNGKKYISHCIENLQKQTFGDWEAFFVNDGSTDGSGTDLNKQTASDGRFHVIHQENGGTARARNAGMDQASGDYIAFIDIDDELAPNMYSKLVQLMDNTQADMGICGYYYKVENTEGSTTYLEKKTYHTCNLKSRDQIKEKLIDLLDKDMLSNIWHSLYRMDLIKERHLRYRDGHVYTEDMVFNWLFIENCNSLAVTEECLYYYVRERAGSTSEKYRDDYFAIRHKEYLQFQEFFKNMGMWNLKSREYVCRRFTERIAGCIENIFHAGKQLSEKDKWKRIQEVISDPDVREALQYAQYKSTKMKLLALPLAAQSGLLTYMVYKLVYEIRKHNPALFHKLKSSR